MVKYLKLAIKFFGWMILGIMATTFLVLVIIQTGPGKKFLAATITNLTCSSDGSGIIIRSISGLIPINFTIGDFRIRDHIGDWLYLKNSKLRLSPLELLSLRLHATEIKIESARMSRAPGSSENSSNEPEGEKPFTLRDIPPFQVDQLLVNEIRVSSQLLGEKIKGKLRAKNISNNNQDGARIVLALDNIKPGNAILKLQGKSGPEFSPLTLDLELTGELENTIGKLLPGDFESSFFFRLQGEGPIDSWKTGITGQIPGKGNLVGNLLLNLNQGTAQGTLKAEFLSLPGKTTSGRGEANIYLEPKEETQDIEAQIRVTDFVTPWIDTSKLEATIKGNDIFGTPHGKAILKTDQLFLREDLGSKFGAQAKKAEAFLELFSDPNNPEASLQLTASNCTFPAALSSSTQPFDLKFSTQVKDGNLETNLGIEGSEELTLKLEAQTRINLSLNPYFIKFPPNPPLSGIFRGKANLGILSDQAALSRQALAGKLTAELELGGTCFYPTFTGKAAISQGEYQNLLTGTHLKDIGLQLDMQQNFINLVKFEAQTPKGGKLDMTGGIKISPQERYPYYFLLSIARAQLIDMEEGTASFSGQLNLKGNLDKGNLQGTLTIDEGEGRIPSAMPVSIPNLEVIEVNKPGGKKKTKRIRKKPGLMSNIALAVQVTNQGGLLIKGRGLDSEWKARIEVSGTAAKPRIKGGIELLDGIFIFLGEELTLKDCSITMDGRYPPVPQLKINAEMSDSQLTVDLQIVGPISSPQVTLSSQPPYPQDEILSRLIYGRPSNQLSGLQALQIANGLRVLQGKGGFFDLLTGWTSFLGDIQVDLTELEGNPEKTAVRVRWSINRDIYIENQQALDGLGNVLITRWNLGQNLELKTQSGFGLIGDAAYLYWHWDY